MNRLSLMLTAAEALWLPAFGFGLMFLASCAVVRVWQHFARPSDYVGIGERGRERGRP